MASTGVLEPKAVLGAVACFTGAVGVAELRRPLVRQHHILKEPGSHMVSTSKRQRSEKLLRRHGQQQPHHTHQLCAKSCRCNGTVINGMALQR